MHSFIPQLTSSMSEGLGFWVHLLILLCCWKFELPLALQKWWRFPWEHGPGLFEVVTGCSFGASLVWVWVVRLGP